MTRAAKADRGRKQTAFAAVDTTEREPETVSLTVDYRTLPLGAAPAPDHVLTPCPLCGRPGARVDVKPGLAPAYYLHVIRIHATRERCKLSELEVCRP